MACIVCAEPLPFFRLENLYWICTTSGSSPVVVRIQELYGVSFSQMSCVSCLRLLECEWLTSQYVYMYFLSNCLAICLLSTLAVRDASTVWWHLLCDVTCLPKIEPYVAFGIQATDKVLFPHHEYRCAFKAIHLMTWEYIVTGWIHVHIFVRWNV